MLISPMIDLFGAALLALLMALAWHDFRAMRLPNVLNGALALLGLAALPVLKIVSWFDAALGAALGMAAFYGLRWAYLKLRGVQALGLGDVKFIGAAGLWVGLSGLPWLVLIASISGLLFGLIVHPLSRNTRIAFGPHLAVGLGAAWVLKVLGLL